MVLPTIRILSNIIMFFFFEQLRTLIIIVGSMVLSNMKSLDIYFFYKQYNQQHKNNNKKILLKINLKSLTIASSKPPPRANPSTAATSGFLVLDLPEQIQGHGSLPVLAQSVQNRSIGNSIRSEAVFHHPIYQTHCFRHIAFETKSVDESGERDEIWSDFRFHHTINQSHGFGDSAFETLPELKT